MSRRGRYPQELRERAVRMVLDSQRSYGSQWEAISSVAEKLGPTPETVRDWVRRSEIDGPGVEAVGETASRCRSTEEQGTCRLHGLLMELHPGGMAAEWR